MPTFFFSLLLFLLLTGSSVFAQGLHTWKSADGRFTIKATLISQNATAVVMKKQDGRIITVPINMLSKVDQLYLGKLKEKAAREQGGGGAGGAAAGGGAGGGGAAGGGAGAAVGGASSDVVLAKINAAGKSPPSWLNTTQLSYPRSLNLKWPKASGKWNGNVHVDHYLYDCKCNPAKWESGIKTLYHILQVNPSAASKAHYQLGDFYFKLFQDYARAAYHLQLAGADRGSNGSCQLATCYYYLGNKKMAYDLLMKYPQYETIKVLGLIGELPQALAFAKANISRSPIVAMNAAEACRASGVLDEALYYYNYILKMRAPSGKSGNYVRKLQQRARVGIEGINLYKDLDLSKVRNGTYTGVCRGYSDNITVSVTISGGKITQCKVIKQRESRHYGTVDVIPRRIVQEQTLAGIDAISGATVTTESIITAAAKAIQSGR